MLLQVVQQALTLTNQLHEPAVGRKVFLVDLQVTADVANTIANFFILVFPLRVFLEA